MADNSANNCTDLSVLSESNVNVPVDFHIVEIPVNAQDESPSDISCLPSSVKTPQHPLEEIADSSGHLLLLKLWQRDEEVMTRRVEVKESRLDSIGKEIFHLACLYFAFHGIVLTLLFTAATQENARTCNRWWIPSTLSGITSLVLICAIQYKLILQRKVMKMLHKDINDSRALSRCVQELRMKGLSFDLSKEPHITKKMKSSSVENKFSPLRWCSQFFLSFALTLTSGFILCSCKLIACS